MITIILCTAFFVLGANSGAVPVSPCVWNDKECIMKSATALVPYIVKGIPDYGLDSIEHLHFNDVNANNGLLQLRFKDLEVDGLSKCDIVDLERPTPDSKIKLVLECPIFIKGQYKAGGKLFTLDVEGEGASEIKTDKFFLDLDISIKTIEKDGKKYYKFSSFDYKYDFLEKVYLKFENLFNGDRTKAEPIEKILDESWKDVAQLGAPVIKVVITKLVRIFEKLFLAIPIDQIELPA